MHSISRYGPVQCRCTHEHTITGQLDTEACINMYLTRNTETLLRLQIKIKSRTYAPLHSISAFLNNF